MTTGTEQMVDPAVGGENHAVTAHHRDALGPVHALAPFHPEAVNAFIGTLRRYPDGRLEAGIVPVHVEAPGRPVLATGERARAIADYVAKITLDAGLPAIRIGAPV